MKLTQTIPGIRIQGGTARMLAKTRTRGTFMMNRMTLATASEAINPQTSWGCASKSTGPGVML